MPLFSLRCQAAALFVLILAGCSKRESPVEVANRTHTLLVGNLTEPNDLDPAYPDSQQTVNIIMALMEGLAQYDPKTCLPTPAAAKSWDLSADGLTWTFHLRSDARWSNGDPLTAHDFVYAYRRILSPKLGAEYASLLFALKNGESFHQGKITDFTQVGAQAVDDHTLVLHLERPVPYLAKLVCHPSWYPVHRATIEKFGSIDQRGTLWTRPGNHVGNGPFILAEWRPSQIIRVTKSPTYWNRAQIRLNEVDYYPIDSESTEESMFRAGQLHITSAIPISKVAVYKNDPQRRDSLRHATALGTYFYGFNVGKPPLDDVRVRRALAYAIDRRSIVEHVSLGGQVPAAHFTPPDTGGFTATARMPYDPGRARQLLAEAGFPGGKNFPRLEILFNTSESHRKIAEAIQQMWRRELGVEVGLYNQEAKVCSDNRREGNFLIARSGWTGDYLDPSTFLDTLTSDSGNNYTRWKNADFDRLIVEARNTPDESKRFALYQRCEQILAEECPIVPIYFYVRTNLRLPAVKGWHGNLLDLHPLTGVYLEP